MDTLFQISESKEHGVILRIKPLPADAGRFGRVCVDILKYGVLIHRPACGAEIAPSPEMTSPVSLS